MFGVLKFFALFFWTIVSQCGCENDDTFVKNDCSFERIIQNETITLKNSTPNRIPDYIYTTQTLLEALANDKDSVTAENLNKFNLGLHQFYLSLANEVYYNRSASQHPVVPYDDPIQMPNATAFGQPELCFYGVQAYGFPGFKKWREVLGKQTNDPYLQYFKINHEYPSDVFIFTGYFDVFNRSYYFVYHTKNNTLKSVQTKWRSNEGTIKTKKIKDVLSFEQESLAHTYDGAKRKYALVNETLYTKLISVLEQVWLPNLISKMYDKMYPRFTQHNALFAAIYRKKVAQLLIESSAHYIKKVNASRPFYATSMNFTSQSTNREFVQTYDEIKIEGFLNWEKYELEDSKVEEHSDEVVFSNTATFSFGADECFVSFVVNSGRKSFRKKYSVKGISITAVYYVRLNESPLKVNRKRDAFRNGSGFLILFQLADFDVAHEFVVRHLGNDMTRVIDDVLDREIHLFDEDVL